MYISIMLLHSSDLKDNQPRPPPKIEDEGRSLCSPLPAGSGSGWGSSYLQTGHRHPRRYVPTNSSSSSSSSSYYYYLLLLLLLLLIIIIITIIIIIIIIIQP